MSLKPTTNFKLSSSVCTAALLLGGLAAHADPYTAQGNTSIAHVQDFTAFEADVVTLFADINAEFSIDFEDIVDSVARVGSSTAGDRNVITASGFGNDALLAIESELNIDAGLETGLALASVGYDLGVSSLQGSLQGTRAEADMSIVLTQSVDSALAIVTHEGDIEIYSDDYITDSTVSVYGNTVEAISGLNRADNGIDIIVNDSSSSAAIALQQTATDAISHASLDGDIKVFVDDDDLIGSIAEVDANLARAVAVGNTAINVVTVEGNSILADAQGQDAPAGYTYGENVDVSAQAMSTYAVATSQNLEGNTSVAGFGFAEEGLQGGVYWDADIQALIADNDDVTFDVDVEYETEDSTVSISGNIGAATARGNNIGNSVTIAANEILGPDSDEILGPDSNTGSVSAIANAQTVVETSIAAHIGETDTSVRFRTGDIYNSSVNVDGNSLQMLASGNAGHNIISVDANLIDEMYNNRPATTGALEGSYAVGSILSYADAAFAINSNQVLGESVVSAALDGVEEGREDYYVATSMTVDVLDGYISDSSISMSDNAMSATAFGNQINGGVGNQIVLTGNAINTTSAIANAQTGRFGVVTASAILADTTIEQVQLTPFIPETTVGGTPAVPFDFSGTVTLGVIYVEATSLTADQIAVLLVSGYTDEGQFLTATAAPLQVTGTFSAEVPAIPGTPVPAIPATYDYIPLSTPKGVIVEFDGEITDSTVVVDGNSVTSAATLNAAANLTTIDATYIGGQESSAELDSVDLSEGQAADHVVTNAQAVLFGAVLSEADALFGVIDPSLSDDWTSVFNSSLSVSDNSMSAASTMNASNNGAALTGNEVETTAVVSNNQIAVGPEGGIITGAESVMTLTAPMAIEDTTLAISGNTNVASSVMNSGVSALSVDANLIHGESSLGLLAFDDNYGFFGEGSPWVNVYGNADYLVGNNQGGIGFVYADAETRIDAYENLRNEQLDDAAPIYSYVYTDGTIDSTTTVANNVTTADAKMNSANNSLVLNAGSDLYASAGVVNGQVAAGSVVSYAFANVDAYIAADEFADGTFDNSTFLFSGNVARASAAANSATNRVTVASNSAYGSSAGSVDVWQGSDVVAVNYGILNAQGNDARVDAEVEAYFGAGFEDDYDDYSVYGSSVTSIGNSIMASAVGNTASNFITLAANDLGTSSAAIHSNQFNTGDIYADVYDSFNDIWGDSEIVNSSTMMTGNSISASAVGNRVVSTISRSGNFAGGFNADPR